MANKLTDRSAETRESADAREKLVRLQSSIIITCFTVSDWYDPADVVEFLRGDYRQGMTICVLLSFRL